MSVHVFVDNSNVIGGARGAAETIEPHVPWVAVRVYFRNLFELIEGGRDVATRVMAGSIPPGNDALWEAARTQGYNTDLLRRVSADDGRLVEQAVDEMLHLKIANAILDHDPPQTLVILSGDGNMSNYDTSFPKQAERALKHGWSVEVWSWRDQLSKAYEKMVRQGVQNLTVHALDSYYESITFVKGGEYQAPGGTMTLNGRVVRSLPPRMKPTK
jgi:hypothetical protein